MGLNPFVDRAWAGDDAGAQKSEEKPLPADLDFFETKIRPVLVVHCHECHSALAKELKGKLRVDSREGLRRGGESGPAVTPGNPAASLLLAALRHEDGLEMPPGKKLPASVAADFERWIQRGASDPRAEANPVTPQDEPLKIALSHWSFQPMPDIHHDPEVGSSTDIDRWIDAGLKQAGLTQGRPARPHELVRRLYLDLTGLPPTMEEAAQILNSSSEESRGVAPDVLEPLVDRLLSSSRFGERWGRHWLDVARYAETSGRQVNFNYPQAWRYRDWVIDAFNRDLPFNDFIRHQIAGDLLPATDSAQRALQLIATGFLAIGPKSHAEENPKQFAADVIDEQIDTVSRAFLGLSMACARCHDHRTDPVTQRDYYALAGIFRSTRTCGGTISVLTNNNPSELLTLPRDSGLPSALKPLTSDDRQRLDKEMADILVRIQELNRKGELQGSPEIVGLAIRLVTLQNQVASYERDGTPKLLAMGLKDRPQMSNAPLLIRGEIDRPGEVVPRGLPAHLPGTSTWTVQGTSGRIELANWIASPANPLTARVHVNRVWMHLTGEGLVTTPDNFGPSGQAPSHPELLDRLAAGFIADGWSTKRLIRRIVLSGMYALSTESTPEGLDRDPDNRLHWRMSPVRLDAEALRDGMLATSGRLTTGRPTGSPVAHFGEGFAVVLGLLGPLDQSSTNRSVYLPVMRGALFPSLTLFNFPDPETSTAQRASTTVPSQALFLLNSPFVIKQSEALADLLQKHAESQDAQIRFAFQRAYSRRPADEELSQALAFLKPSATNGSPRDALTAFCQSLLMSREFLYRP